MNKLSNCQLKGVMASEIKERKYRKILKKGKLTIICKKIKLHVCIVTFCMYKKKLILLN